MILLKLINIKENKYEYTSYDEASTSFAKRYDESKKGNFEEQKSFLETNLGQVINAGVDLGIRALLPGFLEENVIEIKDSLIHLKFKAQNSPIKLHNDKKEELILYLLYKTHIIVNRDIFNSFILF